LLKKPVKKNRWTVGDLVVIAIIFYLLGILTILFLFSFNNDHSNQAYPLNDWIETSSNGPKPRTVLEQKSSNRVQNAESPSLSKTKQYHLWEATTVIRSALYQYVKKYNNMPKDLSKLHQPFPNNFLSALPKDPIFYSNRVYKTFTGTGGWVYQPQKISSHESLSQVIKQSIIPNIEGKTLDIPFYPMEMKIIQDKHELWVVSGDVILRRYPIGLGKNNRTPTGTFYIDIKIMNPNQHQYSIKQNPYGKRALQLSISNYAIHGTNQAESIGRNISNGCIRMFNEDIVELYSLIPLYTSVHIQMNYSLSTNGHQKKIYHPFPLYSQKDNVKEEDQSRVYNWLH